MKIPITAAWHALASISSTEWWVVMRLWLLCDNSLMPGVFGYLPYLSRTSHVLIIRLMQDWKSRPAVWEEGQSWKRGWEVRSEIWEGLTVTNDAGQVSFQGQYALLQPLFLDPFFGWATSFPFPGPNPLLPPAPSSTPYAHCNSPGPWQRSEWESKRFEVSMVSLLCSYICFPVISGLERA